MPNGPAADADLWNSRYPIGTPVTAYPGARPADDPNGERLTTRTRSEAQVLSGHTAVVWVDGHGACIGLTHVDPFQSADAYTPPAKYLRSDGADCCPHAIPVGPGACEACWDLVKWDAVDSLNTVPDPASAPADRAELRDRIAAAIWERQNPGRRWADCEYRWRADAEADADAVLPVLPVLPASIDRADEVARQTDLRDYWHAEAMSATTRIIELEGQLEELRRVADETPQPETQALACVCGSPAIRDGDRWAHQLGAGDDCLYRPDARPRCPDCQMPHALTPSMNLTCASVLASIADRDAAAEPAVGAQQPEEA